uniref:hypothetical protein n=1 Tax=Pyxidicoccus xibeiensis TaxID=2906759 RepID=UPI003899A678
MSARCRRSAEGTAGVGSVLIPGTPCSPPPPPLTPSDSRAAHPSRRRYPTPSGSTTPPGWPPHT